MAEWTQFGSEHEQGRTTACEACEMMCLDAVDGTLTATEQAAFDLHVASCTSCAEQFAEAQRGAAWMEMLKVHKPEPSSSLLQNILAKTTGAEATMPQPLYAPIVMPLPAMPLPTIVASPAVANRGKLLQFRQRVGQTFASFGGGQVYLQPRLAMTAAMAFFSLALTMNLTGTKLSDLRPGALHRTVADAGAHAVRSFQNTRVVYQVEAKVSELRQDQIRDEDDQDRSRRRSDDSSTPTSQPSSVSPKPSSDEPDDHRKPAAPNGSSELHMPTQPRWRLATYADAQTSIDAQPAPRQKGA